MQKTDSALWIGLAGLTGALILYFVLRQSEEVLLRVVLTPLALIWPLAALRWFDANATPKDWMGSLPSPLTLFLSALVGMSLWAVAWWAMSLGDNVLMDAVGPYTPSFIHFEDQWALEVIYFVLLLPLATGWLVFGAMRSRLSDSHPVSAILMMGLYFAVIAAITTPQGLVGLLGYGIVGVAIAFLCWVTRSVWPAVLAYGAFMYTSLGLVDDLFKELGAVSLGDTQWLTAVIFCLLGTVALVQVIRFRQPDSPKSTPRRAASLGGLGWGAVVGLLLVMVLYSASELDQRNQNQAGGPIGIEN